jgi:hypothetical protein
MLAAWQRQGGRSSARPHRGQAMPGLAPAPPPDGRGWTGMAQADHDRDGGAFAWGFDEPQEP